MTVSLECDLSNVYETHLKVEEVCMYVCMYFIGIHELPA